MKIKVFLAIGLIAAFLVSLAPAPRALADGAASTRNILLGIGAAAATLIIINHNKKVHEKYAQDAATQASLASQRNDAQAAYQAELRAYNNERALADNYKHEVSVKDEEISDLNALVSQQKQQLAQMGVATQPVAVAPVTQPAKHGAAPKVVNTQVVSYGWGTI